MNVRRKAVRVLVVIEEVAARQTKSAVDLIVGLFLAGSRLFQWRPVGCAVWSEM